jgi:putative copper export protein
MGFVGLTALALIAAGPAAQRISADVRAAVTARLARVAAVLGVLAIPAVLTDLAHAGHHGYHYGAAWHSLYNGTSDGLLSGLELTLILAGSALVAPLAARKGASGPARRGLLPAGFAAGAVSLGLTKFPSAAPHPGQWGRTVFETAMWMFHLYGGAIWLGGVAGLTLLALPGVIAPADRGVFWSVAIRRFSAAAMGCVAGIALSGLFLYWEHVDGPSQLLSTMYGRVLGVKILIFGALLLLGMFNQFWLHPRIEALRAHGDNRPLRILLVRRFPAVVTAEGVLGLLVVFVAPFLHGSARNQAFQAAAARHSATPLPLAGLPKLPPKTVTASTWAWGIAETVVVIALMAAGYWYSGVLARRRAGEAPVPVRSDPQPVEA